MSEKSLYKPIQEMLVQVVQTLEKQDKTICTAESCTGGQLAMWLTELPGSSSWFESGLVTYSNDAKIAMLGVRQTLIEAVGAVSEPVALAMVRGALKQCRADVAVAITGIAGPSGATMDKPIGTVCFAVADQQTDLVETVYFGNQSRHEIRAHACLYALTMVQRFFDHQYKTL